MMRSEILPISSSDVACGWKSRIQTIPSTGPNRRGSSSDADEHHWNCTGPCLTAIPTDSSATKKRMPSFGAGRTATDSTRTPATGRGLTPAPQRCDCNVSATGYIGQIDQFPPTRRTQLKRPPKRGVYDKAAVHAILDEGLICHVGFALDGQTYVIPTGYVRVDDCLYIHGSPARRMLGALSQAIDVCVAVTLLDGLVLARSAFHHSMNYRSVVVLGKARLVC